MKYLALLLFPVIGFAQQVKWEETLAYPKPAPIDAAIPAIATDTPRWYVNLGSTPDPNSPSGSCTSAAPCQLLSDVAGKAGTHGDTPAAVIYVGGTGSFGNPTIYGSSGHPVIIRASGNTTFTGTSTLSGHFEYVTIDGMLGLITFSLTSASDSDASILFTNTGTTFTNVYFKNVRWKVVNKGHWLIANGRFSNLSFVNNEFSAVGASTGNHSAQFIGGTGASSGLLFKSNIFRDDASSGAAIELIPTQAFTDITIDRNVFHDLYTSVYWGLNGGSYLGTISQSNNLIWDTSSGCALTWSSPATTRFYGNTCYNWGTTGTAAADVIAFGDQALTSNPPGDFRNNLLYATGTGLGGQTKYPFPANASVDSFNGCRSGVSCGTSSQVISAATFVSVTENNASFLKPAVATTAIDTGTTLASSTPDFSGYNRPRGGAYDLGALEYGAGSTTPNTPTGGSGIACAVGAYGPWITERVSNCTASVQTLYQTRYREVTTSPANGGAACPVLSEQNLPAPTQSCVGTGGLPPILAAAPPQVAPYNHDISTRLYNPQVLLNARHTTTDQGAMRPQCDYSHMAFLDPIVYPGVVGTSHMHTFAGNRAVDQNSTPTSLVAAGNGTCWQFGIDNRSGYWVPSVIDTRTGTPIAPNDFMVYYKTGYTGPTYAATMEDLPPGLVIIAGRTQADTPATSVPNYASHIQFSCFDPVTGTGPSQLQYIPPCAVNMQVWLMIIFPQCWDGVNLDSANHRSHMAYLPFNGTCPADHPRLLPQITYLVHWPIRVGDDSTYWRLSSDMYYGADPASPGGYTAHGDWMNGWTPSVVTSWMDICLRVFMDCG